jgi:hypothetical protein
MVRRHGCPSLDFSWSPGSLVQKAIVFSRGSKNSDDIGKEWRSELAYRTMLLLRTSVANIQYGTTQIPAYELPELSGVELELCVPNREFLRHANIPHSESIDSMRVPQKVAHLLRETICGQEDRLTHPIHIQKEMNLLGDVDQFVGGFFGMRQFMVTISHKGIDYVVTNERDVAKSNANVIFFAVARNRARRIPSPCLKWRR